MHCKREKSIDDCCNYSLKAFSLPHAHTSPAVWEKWSHTAPLGRETGNYWWWWCVDGDDVCKHAAVLHYPEISHAFKCLFSTMHSLPTTLHTFVLCVHFPSAWANFTLQTPSLFIWPLTWLTWLLLKGSGRLFLSILVCVVMCINYY